MKCSHCIPYEIFNDASICDFSDPGFVFIVIQAGCIVKTECQVQFVVKNLYDSFQEGKSRRKRRRWRVYLNEIDYITSDFVVLSGRKQINNDDKCYIIGRQTII